MAVNASEDFAENNVQAKKLGDGIQDEFSQIRVLVPGGGSTPQKLGDLLGGAAAVTATGSTTARTLADRAADVINVKDYGAKGDGVADDTAAIQAAINAIGATRGAVVLFPPGIYLVSSTLRVSASSVALVGQNFKGNKLGPEIRATAEAMSDVILVQTTGAGNYGFQMRSILISAAASVVTKPVSCLHLKDVSEFYVSEVMTTGCQSGFKLNGANIGRLDGITTSSHAIGVNIVSDNTGIAKTVWPTLAGAAVWIQNANLWDSSTAAIQIANGDAYAINIVNSWIEQAKNGLLVTHDTSNYVTATEILMEGVHFSNGTTSPYTGARFVRGTAATTAAFSFTMEGLTVRSCKIENVETVAIPYNIEILKGGNTNAGTSATRFTIQDNFIRGASTATFNTDLPINVAFLGSFRAVNGAGAAIALAAGTGRYGYFLSDPFTGRWFLSEVQPWGTDATLTFTSPMSAASGTPDWLFNTTATRTGGGYIFKITNNGVPMFGVSTGGSPVVAGGSGNVFAGGITAALAANLSLILAGNKVAADAGPDVQVSSAVTRTAGSLLTVVNNATTVARVGWDGGVQPGQLNAGGIASSSTIYSGTGVPSNTFGANGDFYLRSDTPGTVNQRLYIKSAGAWVGIL